MGTVICPNCQYINEDRMRFCIMCGTTLAKICSNCQHANPAVAHFCGMCGQPLSAAEGTPFTLHPSAERIVVPPTTLPVSTPTENGAPPASLSRNGVPELTGRELVGERHTASILLADVRNSTVLMEQIGTEAWVGVMNNIFQVLEAEIYRMGGEIDQYRGDGLLAFFGARTVHEDDPERAVLAGLSIQRSFDQYAKHLKKQFPDVELKLRVGINTGEVIVTSIGSEDHYENTAMGGAIAVAARMESSAEPGTVLVSEDTYDLTNTRFEYEPLGEISVKGISEPVAVYRPTGLKEGPMRPFSRASQWIGYEEQVEVLRENILDLSSGHGSIVMISGDKGMGKSYLIQHVRQELRRELMLREIEEAGEEQEPTNLRYRGDVNLWCFSTSRSYEQSWPYAAWRDLFASWLRILQKRYNTDDIGSAFSHFIEQQWPSEHFGLVSYLRDFLNLPMNEQQSTMLANQDAGTYQQYFFEAVKEWVHINASERSLILVFSNIHWGDEPSFDLLKYCLPLSDSLPVMWLFTMRPVRSNAPGWNFRHYLGTEYPHRLVWIEMRPLTIDEANQLIDQMVGSDSLDEEEREFIYTRSEGNPYYLREIIYAMMDNGSLVLNEETSIWVLNPNEDLVELPDSLQGILQEYIAKLSAEERHVLQVASVMGSFFWSLLLQRMLNMEEDTLNRHLTALQRYQLIVEEYVEENMGMRFSFVSTLMREATYESLLLPQRRAYHRQCAELIEQWLEEQEGQVTALNQVYGYLAFHFEMAELYEKQMYYHIQAAEVAESLHANEEANWHLGRALEVSETILAGEFANEEETDHREIYRKQFEIFSKRRWVRILMADVTGSIADADRALKLTEGPLEGEYDLRVDAILMYSYSVTMSLFTKEESQKISNLCEEALYLSRQMGDQRRELETLVQITFIRANTSHANVYEPSMQALHLAWELQDVNMQFSIMLSWGYHLVAHDQAEEGMKYIEDALRLTDTVDDPIAQMNVLNVIGPQFERAGDYYRWLTEFVEVRLTLSRKIGSRITEADALLHAGTIRANYLGDFENGMKELEESSQMLEAAPSRLFSLLRIAQCYSELDDYEKGKTALDEAELLIRNITLELGRVGYKLVRIMLNNQQDEEDHLREALALAEEIDQLGVEQGISQQYRMAAASHASSLHRKMAVLLGNRSGLSEEDQKKRTYHLEQSLSKAQLSLSIYEDFGYTNAAEITGEWILYRMGQALIATGQRTDALLFIKRAYDEMMRKHDMIPEGSHLRRTYLENIRHHRQIQASYRLLSL
ncbi:MAG: adenylate/guanylate cyclase domain-containing protein [Anaerolineae bacterium]|jgi:class 3 adenylate cyclase/predicted ATPase|nr:adenylate/guanylate cyclase domain-containing protein [Anaerolineae bacterium]